MNKKIIITFFLLSILVNSCFLKRQEKKYPLDIAKKVVWENCALCHAPSTYLTGVRQDEMVKKLGGIENLKSFIWNEFRKNKSYIIKKHSSIKLSRKEVKSVILYLEDMNNPGKY